MLMSLYLGERFGRKIKGYTALECQTPPSLKMRGTEIVQTG